MLEEEKPRLNKAIGDGPGSVSGDSERRGAVAVRRGDDGERQRSGGRVPCTRSHARRRGTRELDRPGGSEVRPRVGPELPRRRRSHYRSARC